MAPNGHRPRNGEENKSTYCCTVVIWLKNVEDSRQPEREEEKKRRREKHPSSACVRVMAVAEREKNAKPDY